MTAPATAQSVGGAVVDDATGQPLAVVTVELLDSAGLVLQAVETGDSGRFSLPLPDAGPFVVRAQRLGYSTARTEAFEVAGDAVVDVELRLTTRAVPLPPVTVSTTATSGRLREAGFYGRQERGVGRFYTQEDIEARGAFAVTDILRMEPSAEFLYDAERQGWVVIFRGAARMSFDTTPCFPLLVLDGVRFRNSREMDDLVHPDDILGMEIYPSGNGAPPRYAGLETPCGVILIWTLASTS